MTWEMERVTFQLVIAGSSISLDRPIHLRMYSTCGGCLYEATAQALLRCNRPLSNLPNNICLSSSIRRQSSCPLTSGLKLIPCTAEGMPVFRCYIRFGLDEQALVN